MCTVRTHTPEPKPEPQATCCHSCVGADVDSVIPLETGLIGLYAHSYSGGVRPTDQVSVAQARAYSVAIANNLDAVLGGADFPDFLYACGSYADHHDAAEAAHWPPFQAAAVRYLQQTVTNFSEPSSWSVNTSKLVAFVFGLAVHYVTDELWEGLAGGLGSARGFTEMVDAFALGNSGSGNVAESIANFGGDFYAAWSVDESGIDPWGRSFPIDDLVAIYHQTPKNASANFTDVTRSSLEECKGLFDVGLWALKTFGALLYPIYNQQVQQLPFVTEHLYDARVSGVEDMAAYVAFAWQRLGRWLSTSPPANAPPRAQPQQRAEADDADDRSTHALFQLLAPFVEHTDLLRSLTPADVQSYFTLSGGGAAGGTPAWRLHYQGPPHLAPALCGVLRALTAHFFGGALVALAETPARQRSTLLHSAETQPAGGPPQEPAAHPYSPTGAQQAMAANPSAPSPSLAGGAAPSPMALRGSALAAGDFDGDGVDDLAIGSYGDGGATGPRAGSVSVTYGNGSSLDVGRGGGVATRFGEAMAVLDFNLDGIDDLAVGSPGSSDWDLTNPTSQPYADTEATFRLWGKVRIYFGAKGRGLAAPPLVLRTSTAFTALGAVLGAQDINADGHPDLLLGCPQSNNHGGRLLGFLASGERKAGAVLEVDSAGAAALDLAGPAHFGWFGASMAVVPAPPNRSLLLVGAPFFRPNASCTEGCVLTGAVFGYELGAAGHGGGRCGGVARFPPASPLALFTLVGDEPLGEFGEAIAANGSGLVAITAPAAGQRGALFGPGARAGRVSLLEASKLIALRGSVPLRAVSAHAHVWGESAGGYLGRAVGWTDLDGDGRDELFCGAPHTSKDALLLSGRETGAAFMWRGAALPSGNQSAAAASWHAAGSRQLGRFGAAIAPLRTAEGVRLAVGSPRAAVGGAAMAGAVDVMVL